MQLYIGAVFCVVTLAHVVPPQHVDFPSTDSNHNALAVDVAHLLDPRSADFQRNVSIVGLSASTSTNRPFVDSNSSYNFNLTAGPFAPAAYCHASISTPEANNLLTTDWIQCDLPPLDSTDTKSEDKATRTSYSQYQGASKIRRANDASRSEVARASTAFQWTQNPEGSATLDIDSNITVARDGDGNSRGVVIRQQAVYDIPAEDIVGHAEYRGPQEVSARVQKMEISSLGVDEGGYQELKVACLFFSRRPHSHELPTLMLVHPRNDILPHVVPQKGSRRRVAEAEPPRVLDAVPVPITLALGDARLFGPAIGKEVRVSAFLVSEADQIWVRDVNQTQVPVYQRQRSAGGGFEEDKTLVGLGVSVACVAGRGGGRSPGF
ncbi:hypothetical protein NEUTE1DRAFT_85706 [Neurospora tetrasperma FGSC 2508]|uniref:Uncharacterized protein n=1 Tax=Neurospora tetrasperma (strain FGSC 2508 / ATCC MYA-4615 / P0657) TaxID=510951 RepID=F8MTT6_NEUT8|nr:uncharacterized protein NEUTE1DRAFT_85706 [Neurospora tetrasperma FGSC 2508]EGO55418.1 hypothetical protein NEUTE1DRAFT_85706 [Neurospora tetrasperma FGSC 2508]EGZ69355.1 hypothetical protein NEUTE2DRAFT_115794 [Neurospora tetrasperma FGSC 2509]